MWKALEGYKKITSNVLKWKDNKSKIQIKQAPDMRMAHFQYLHYALSYRSANFFSPRLDKDKKTSREKCTVNLLMKQMKRLTCIINYIGHGIQHLKKYPDGNGRDVSTAC